MYKNVNIESSKFLEMRDEFLKDAENIYFMNNINGIHYRNWEIFCLKMKNNTLEAISDNYNLTKEMVRQIVNNVYKTIFNKYDYFLKYCIKLVNCNNHILIDSVIFDNIDKFMPNLKVIISNILKKSGLRYIVDKKIIHNYTNSNYKSILKELEGFLNNHVPRIGDEEQLRNMLINFNNKKYIFEDTLITIMFAYYIDKFVDGYIFKETTTIEKMLYVLKKYFVKGLSIKYDRNEFLDRLLFLFPSEFKREENLQSKLLYLIKKKDYVYKLDNGLYIHKDNLYME